LERSYIAKGMRWRAQELATEELGLRHEFEIKRAHAREVTQERYTSLDREIERRSKDQRIELKSLAKRSGSIEQGTLISRLEQLEVMGLAKATFWATHRCPARATSGARRHAVEPRGPIFRIASRPVRTGTYSRRVSTRRRRADAMPFGRSRERERSTVFHLERV
jgi:hypothetical protein